MRPPPLAFALKDRSGASADRSATATRAGLASNRRRERGSDLVGLGEGPNPPCSGGGEGSTPRTTFGVFPHFKYARSHRLPTTPVRQRFGAELATSRPTLADRLSHGFYPLAAGLPQRRFNLRIGVCRGAPRARRSDAEQDKRSRQCYEAPSHVKVARVGFDNGTRLGGGNTVPRRGPVLGLRQGRR